VGSPNFMLHSKPALLDNKNLKPWHIPDSGPYPNCPLYTFRYNFTLLANHSLFYSYSLRLSCCTWGSILSLDGAPAGITTGPMLLLRIP
jgi:hypothetical protein